MQPRFALPNDGFSARTQSINELLASYSVVCGTGSWIEAHLVARLGDVQGIPNLHGCGVTPDEVVKLCKQASASVLVFLTASIAADHGIALCLQLKALANPPSIFFLVDLPSRLPPDGTLLCDAIVSAASFGNGAVRDALVAISKGQSYRDPTLNSDDYPSTTVALKPREQQVLELLARGMSNKEIGFKLNIAAVTVRDYVQHLCRKFDALNRTDVVFKATSSGFLHQPSDLL
ncbi:MAG: LuxR C-terminal-related transcriptional regulator [Cyanobium sp. LacPavin_0920_WC12_MAG_62_9]|nr:LuxR C-terminal-related transcriptional regulator [Cyanobium sp. LacPavin_0920_WC12_MAG_62_9]